jgi:DNA-binding NtrC family response regulator
MTIAHSPAVLLAHAEPSALTSLASALAAIGYRVTTVTDGTAAVALLSDRGHHFVAAVLGGRLAGLSGLEAFALARLRGWRAPTLLIDGGGPLSLPDPAADRAVRFMAEPFLADDVVRAVCELLGTVSP